MRQFHQPHVFLLLFVAIEFILEEYFRLRCLVRAQHRHYSKQRYNTIKQNSTPASGKCLPEEEGFEYEDGINVPVFSLASLTLRSIVTETRASMMGRQIEETETLTVEAELREQVLISFCLSCQYSVPLNASSVENLR